MLNIILIVALFLSFVGSNCKAASVTVDYSNILKTQTAPPIGENMNYLLSSDKNLPRTVSMKARAEEMQLSILRFPYGHYGDNYLFTDAPYNDGISGLTPRVASLGAPPSELYWALDDNGYFKDALDFDEFMSYVDKTGAEPLIMVNMLSYDETHYPETVVTFADLITHAKEWVRYANITRDYNVKYWQLGNEVAQHSDKSTYLSHFVEMASAMKSIDPTIKVGFGEDGRQTSWLADALADPDISQYIDFISPHQYIFNTYWTETYESWRDYSASVTPKINQMQNQANASVNHKDVPIIVTEYGVTGGMYAENDPKGLRYVQSAADDSFIGVTNDGLNLTKLANVTSSNQLINIVMFDDSWLGLKPNDGASGFIKAQNTQGSPLSLDGTASDDGAKWRLKYYAQNSTYYLESKLHLGWYLDYDSTAARFNLGSKDKHWLAEPLLLQWQNNILPKANMWFPRDTQRMIKSAANKKFVGMQMDNTLKADAFRSESDSYQFVMVDESVNYGTNTVSLHPQDNPSSFITLDSVVSAPITRSNTSNISTDGLWVFYSSVDYYQLESYNHSGSYLIVNSDGSVTANGLVSDLGTRFTHAAPPEPNPLPPSAVPSGNFANDLWKSLVFADMTLSASANKNVNYLVHWNTHTSFDGKYGGYHNESNSLENNAENTLTPVGQVIKIINTNTLSHVINLSTVNGKVRTFASFEPTTGEMSIILLNKNNQTEQLELNLTAYNPTADYQRWIYTGTDTEDEYPTYLQDDDGSNAKVTISGNTITTDLDATSLTIIRLVDPSVASAPIGQTVTLRSVHSGLYVGLDNSISDPAITSNLVKANRSTDFITLSSLFQLDEAATGYVSLSPYGGDSQDLVRYYSSAQNSLAVDADAANLSQWLWGLNGEGNVLLESKNYNNKYMRTSATSNYKLDRDGGTGAWSQYLWQKAPLVPIGKEVWIRSLETNQLLYVDSLNSMFADDELPTDSDAHFFTVERLSGDYVALKSTLTGQYVKSATDPSWGVTANGALGAPLDYSILFKVKLVDGLVLFESALHTGQYLRVNVNGDQSINTNGGNGNWSQFYWGERQ